MSAGSVRMTTARVAVSRGGDRPFDLESAVIHGPGTGEILVRVVASGVCHTDILMRSRIDVPVVLGHEGAGIVEHVGPGVEGIAVGDAVLLTFSFCGVCPQCSESRPSYCEQFGGRNLPRTGQAGGTSVELDGTELAASFFGQSSFASHVVAAARSAVVVPPGTDLSVVAPLGCGIQTGAGTVLNVLRPGPEDAFVVFGGGGVGLAAVMAAVAGRVRTVLVVDPVPARRALAAELGASGTIDPGVTDPVAEVRRHAPRGATHALDTTGIPAVLHQALASVGPLGQVVEVGAGTAEVTVDLRALIGGGRTLRGSTEGDADPSRFLPQLLELHARGLLPLEKIITQYPFEAIDAAVADSLSGRSVKPVLVF